MVISTTSEDKVPEGVLLYHDLEQALKDGGQRCVCSGAMIYKQLINRVDKLYITHINKKYEGDVFPEIDPENLAKSKNRVAWRF